MGWRFRSSAVKLFPVKTAEIGMCIHGERDETRKLQTADQIANG
jgi:hypothetical protein